MTETYTVYGTPRSRAFRVIWMLEELGLPYALNPVPPQDPKVRELSPTGKVPVLVVDETPICDSSAILTYLGDRHGRLTSPAGTLARAEQDTLLFRVLDEFDALVWTAARHSFVLPEKLRVPDVKNSLKAEFQRNASRLEQTLGDKAFLTGAEISVPDFVLTHCLGWAMIAQFPPLPDGLKAYHDRMRERPAYRAAAQAS